jgi:regulator of cell morphogenesis and NO signaling
MNHSISLAELAVTHPAAARVFYRNRLDFCCGGRRSLADACTEKGLDADDILEAIAIEDPQMPDATRWDTQPLPALVEHIVGTYHRRLRQTLPELVRMARKVEAVHGEKASCPKGLADMLDGVQVAVLDHLDKEEQILFPIVMRGMGANASAPIHALEVEHEHHKEHLIAIRSATTDLTPPPEACTTWRALYLGLQHLEQELMEHIHLENNVLFRRALTDEREVHQ